VLLGVAAPLGTVAGTVAAAVATAVGRGALPPGLVVMGQPQLPTASLLRDVAAAGITVHRFVGTLSQTSW
jgi:hypothetical protein